MWNTNSYILTGVKSEKTIEWFGLLNIKHTNYILPWIFDRVLLGFGMTVEDIAETTEDMGIGMLERRMPSWGLAFTPLSPLVVTTPEAVLVVVVEKLLVLVVGGCLDTKKFKLTKK